ncbi:MAG: hypothetical protein ABSC73_08600 [Acidimicrobiales bacterium]
MSIPNDAHEWVSFADPKEDRTWVFDVTFLLSAWRCIYNAGCQGVLTGPAAELAEGCCSYGAHLSDPKDARRVEAAAARLSPSQFQHIRRARRVGVIKHQGKELTTRLVDGACIFLNRPGFPGGPGCALHRAALEAGIAPRRYKPDVCWQLPVRREDATDEGGHVTSTITQWERRHWGPAGDEFHWWCTEAPEAFVAAEPVYLGLADELRALVGPAVYKTLAGYLDEARARGAPLPHPVVRRAKGQVRSSASSSGSSDS